MSHQSPGQQVQGVNEKLALPFLAMCAYTSFLASQMQFPYTQNRDNLCFKVTITQKKIQSFHQCTVNVHYKNHTVGTRSSGSCNLSTRLRQWTLPWAYTVRHCLRENRTKQNTYNSFHNEVNTKSTEENSNNGFYNRVELRNTFQGKCSRRQKCSSWGLRDKQGCQENARTLRGKMAGSRHSKFVRGKISELESIIVSFLCIGSPFRGWWNGAVGQRVCCAGLRNWVQIPSVVTQTCNTSICWELGKGGGALNCMSMCYRQ